MTKFWDTLAQWLEARRSTIAELSKGTEIPAQTIYSWKRAKSVPHSLNRQKLFKFFGTTEAKFYAGPNGLGDVPQHAGSPSSYDLSTLPQEDLEVVRSLILALGKRKKSKDPVIRRHHQLDPPNGHSLAQKKS